MDLELPKSRESRASKAVDSFEVFRKRKAVIFLSYCRFWEKHDFVQQSLAKKLCDEGVEVVWLDGSGWRPYRPTLYWNSDRLLVKQLPEIPGRRFDFLSRKNRDIQKRAIDRVIHFYGDPVIWVQAGLDESLVKALPKIDVFSTFDDPFRFQPDGPLCRKADWILCQNRFTLEKLAPVYPDKAVHALPPMELPVRRQKKVENARKTMGYIGSFFSQDYHLDLFEKLVDWFPERDFLIVGRTDREGEKWARRLSKRSQNFEYHPWVPKEQLTPFWERLDATLLLYRPNLAQDGAFPVKALHSLHYGVPLVLSEVPKNRDLFSFFEPGFYQHDIRRLVDEVVYTSENRISEAYEFLADKMDPTQYLTRVSKLLQKS